MVGVVNAAPLLLAALLAAPAAPGTRPAADDAEAIELDPENMGDLRPRVVLRLVDVFLRDPLTEDAAVAMGGVVAFAEQSDDVEVVIHTDVVNWIGDDDGSGERAPMLLAAFIAGNVAAQLDVGVTRNDAHSGLVAALGVYRALREDDADFRSRGLEAHLERYRDGTLASFLAESEEER